MISWRKSSFSSTENPNCVEVARLPAGIAFRDSKNPGGPVLLIKRPALDGHGDGQDRET
ncbi:MAG TPA: DUF397 domain-containing protein [Actinophytocola sp.]|uniref:DUF397 domain-containing protein n=1 Tax=Actinophytocola sp. TaxID=1872138 RepID=UPI002DBD5CD6|nr:DUF397 domain-containing protein [Actinophytocola sp.]HEU5473926.1 DUF397 domain-containing protein [Actinophytocola sp.]